MSYQITYYKPERQGIIFEGNKCMLAVEFCTKQFEDCGLLFWDEAGTEQRVAASADGKRGTLFGFVIEGDNLQDCTYQYYQGERVFPDPYARGYKGLEKWGDCSVSEKEIKGRFVREEFDWGDDKLPTIPFHQSLVYGLNVRAFTKDKSSGVKHKGTFEGIVKKIDYLKEIGVTCVELMPCYEYEECMKDPSFDKAKRASGQVSEEPLEEVRLNCWGFGEAYYFAPKASYASENPEISFKKMVKALHENGIEVMMQFYFSPLMNRLMLIEILRFWAITYHIDGFRLIGQDLPLKMIVQDPVLKELKIRCVAESGEELASYMVPGCKNLLLDNGGFKNDMKRFLKGEENLTNGFVCYNRANPKAYGVLNALTDYEGFSLYDLYTYDYKHNERNGEENRDGSDFNFSWNCGIEGETRKKAILQLRMKLMKNALAFLMLSQGVPFLFSGDEFGNTKYGNNNPYCQDNEIGHIKWTKNVRNKELLAFYKQLLSIRQKYTILHSEKEYQLMDVLGCGYPDISYHGKDAWRPDLTYVSRSVGVMLCGKYAQAGEEDFLYLAVNMHFKEQELAFPKLPKGYVWERIFDTALIEKEQNKFGADIMTVEERSVSLYRSVKKAGK